MPSYLRIFLTVSGYAQRLKRRTLSRWFECRPSQLEPLTDYALVAVVATLDVLGLQLRLDYIQRTCCYAGDQAASRASFMSCAELDESIANIAL